MDEKNLKLLRNLSQQCKSLHRKNLETMKALVKVESQILEILEDEVDFYRSYDREVRDLKSMTRRLDVHNFHQKVSRLLPDLEREVRASTEVAENIKDTMVDAMVQVGDVQLTLGELLRSLEGSE